MHVAMRSEEVFRCGAASNMPKYFATVSLAPIYFGVDPDFHAAQYGGSETMHPTRIQSILKPVSLARNVE